MELRNACINFQDFPFCFVKPLEIRKLTVNYCLVMSKSSGSLDVRGETRHSKTCSYPVQSVLHGSIPTTMDAFLKFLQS